MSEQRDLEQRVSEWLEGEARGEIPDWILGETLEQTRMEPQQVTFGARFRMLRPAAQGNDEPAARRGFTMFTAMRAAVLALLIGVVGLAGMIVIVDDGTVPITPGAESPASNDPVELLDLMFDGEIIPEEFVGVLFSRKAYPTDQEITYTHGFLPPNTFIRHVESGQLGIRPNSETQVIRAGRTQDDAEVVMASEEALLGPGDIFIQRDLPWGEFGKDALGEMWTPGDDAIIFSLAIREQERCCSMSHPGMVSRWYNNLTSGVQELSDAPMRFRVRRWEVPVGDSLSYTTDSTPSLWMVDAGQVAAMPAEDFTAGVTPSPRPTRANSPIWSMSLSPGADMVVESIGSEPAVLYQLIVEPAAAPDSP